MRGETILNEPVSPTGTGRAFQVLRREAVFQGHVRVDRVTFRHTLHRGGWSAPLTREVMDRGHAAVVLPYDPARDAVVLIEQARAGALNDPAGPWTLEAVAGIIDQGETAVTTARREAIEEAGLTVTDLARVGDILVTPGALTERFEIFIGRIDATGVGGIHGLDHEGEDIRVLDVSFDAAMAMVADGRVRVSHTVIALLWLAVNRSALRARWAGG